MSDNIDYAELDKAVDEAIKNRSASSPSASSRPVARPATAVHHSHGQFMDFVSAQPRRTIHPTSVAAKPIVRPTAQPTAARPVARPTAPASNRITTAPQPVIVPRSTKIGTAVRPVRPSVSAQIQQKQQAVANKTVAKPVTKPVSKPVNRTALKPVAKPAVSAEAKPAAKATPKPEAKPAIKVVSKADNKKSEPNANNYSLGVRSPFMTNTKVEKRPLGKDIPETSTSSLRSTKNIYSSKSPSKASHVSKKHMVTEAPKKHSGWLWTLVVLLVIAAGAGLGHLAYILVFAK